MSMFTKQVKCPNCEHGWLRGRRCVLCGYKMEKFEHAGASMVNAKWNVTLKIIGGFALFGLLCLIIQMVEVL